MAAIAIPRTVDARSISALWSRLGFALLMVVTGQIHYFIAGGLRGGGSSSATAIESWVGQHFLSTTAGGVTIEACFLNCP